MDLNRRVITLCILRIQAEFEKRIGDAQTLYKEAWDSASDDYEKCIAAHYVAYLETEPHTALEWNLTALNHARQVQSELVEKFFPSLYVNFG
jgi:hypothetical protein